MRNVQPLFILIVALFLLLPLLVILVMLVVLLLTGYSLANSIEEIYLSSDKIAGISAWSAGFCLSLIAYYAFIHDKSKSEQESILRERSERQRTAESFITRTNTKYDIVKQQITECMIIESKYSKSDGDISKDMIDESFIRLRRSCLQWICEIDIEIDRLEIEIDRLEIGTETEELSYSEGMSKSVTLRKGGDRIMTFEQIKDKIEEEGKRNSEEPRIKCLPAFEEMIDTLHNFYNGLIYSYGV